MKCWICDAEPEEVCETTALGAPERTYIPGRWSPGADGHEHALHPPTPAELEQAGYEALERIRAAF